MSYEDLELYGLEAYQSPFWPKTKAVGWLAPNKPFATGRIDPRVIGRLFDLVTGPWGWPFDLDWAHCTFCPNARPRTPTQVTWQERRFLVGWTTRRAEVGSTRIYVPGKECVYISPSLILHFVVAHHYLPPQEFIEALSAAPDIDSPEFGLALKENGGPDLRRLDGD